MLGSRITGSGEMNTGLIGHQPGGNHGPDGLGPPLAGGAGWVGRTPGFGAGLGTGPGTGTGTGVVGGGHFGFVQFLMYSLKHLVRPFFKSWIS